MSIRKYAFAAAAVVAATPAAFANNGFSPASNEAGFVSHAMPASGVTRTQVREEARVARDQQVSLDGWHNLGGEAGWVYEAAS